MAATTRISVSVKATLPKLIKEEACAGFLARIARFAGLLRALTINLAILQLNSLLLLFVS
jgi:hypothetical protein